MGDTGLRAACVRLCGSAGGGSQAIPLHCGALCNAVRGALCTGPRSRAAVDLAFHFTPRLLQTKVAGRLAVQHGYTPWSLLAAYRRMPCDTS